MNLIKTRPGRRRPKGPSSKDLGLVHYQGGAGKGSVPRNCFSKEFKEAEVWENMNGAIDGMSEVKPGRSVKTYK